MNREKRPFHSGRPLSHRGRQIETGSREDLGYERILFFSDAVMAIAITLLAIDLRLPAVPAAELPAQLTELSPRIMSFVISFALVGVYWNSHHRYFRYIRRFDTRLIVLNMVFLLFVALMPFAASLLGQFNTLPLALSVYAAVVAATGLSIGAIWWYASGNHRLVDKTLDPRFIAARNRIALVVPLIFLISIPVAWVNPLASTVVWWTGPFASIIVLRGLGGRR